MESKQSPLQPKDPPQESEVVIRAWNMMRGIDWAALPVIVELLGVKDVDAFINQLVIVRDWQTR